MQRKLLYGIVAVALLANVGVEFTSLYQPLDEALEATLFLIILLVIILLYNGERRFAKS